MQGSTINKIIIQKEDGTQLDITATGEARTSDQDLRHLLEALLATQPAVSDEPTDTRILSREGVRWKIEQISQAGRFTGPYGADGRNYGPKATYRGTTGGAPVTAASAASFFAISGSATKLVTVQRIILTGFTLTAIAYVTVLCQKYRSIITGGTATPLNTNNTRVDSQNNPGTVNLLNFYTAAPTDGSPIDTQLGARRILMQATTPVASSPLVYIEWDFRSQSGETTGIPLRGIAEYIGCNFGTAPATGVQLSVEVEWTEE